MTRRSVATGIRPDTERKKEAFVGRAPLISGILLPNTDQIASSRIILRTVNRVFSTVQTMERYRQTLLKLAQEIKDARELKNKDRTKITVDPTSLVIPRTKKEALEAVLRTRGIDADVILEKETKTATLFTVTVKRENRTTTHNVFVPDSTMEKEGIYDQIIAILKITSVIESGYVMHIEGRISPDKIEICAQRLKKRLISFDGFNHNGTTMFTYTPIGNTFAAPKGLVGEELVRHIDNKIIRMHIDYKKPFEPEVLEAQALENPTILRTGGELDSIANVLDHLARCEIDPSLIPTEYKAAVLRLREEQSFINALSVSPIKSEKVREFQDAFSELDHPAHRLVQILHPHYIGPDGEISDEGKLVLRETLELSARDEIAIDENALRNIGIAYAQVSGEKTEVWDLEDLRRNHFKMMFVIRSSLRKMTESAAHGIVFEI
ncbi:hypothetical protein KKE92_02650 [Candidatus Micrarchaeota archaeon]|nr:hypothetical protein [Candidatus Micrarchaeota archaeon]